MTDADDASARLERFAADVDAKLRQLRDEVAAAEQEVEAELHPPLPPRPQPAPAPAPVAPARTREPLVIELPPEPSASTRPAARAPVERGSRPWLRRLGMVLGIVGAIAIAIVVLAASVGPAFLPYDTYVVRSGSMAPTIPTGSLVVVTETDASNVGPGDIITFEAPDNGRRVTHRIVSIEPSDVGPVFVTKGDHNPAPDPWRVRATGTQLQHRFHVRYLGYVFGALASAPARIALVVLAGVVLALEVRRRRA